MIASMITVLWCADIEASRAFYEKYGLVFTTERHGAGPEHYAAVIGTTPRMATGTTLMYPTAVLELYPAIAKEGFRAGDSSIMFETDEPGLAALRDPDDRRVVRVARKR